MASSNALTTRFAADITDFERQIKRMQQLNAKVAAKLAADQAAAAQRAAKAWNDNNPATKLEKQFRSLGAEIKRFAPIVAGLFGAREIASAADQWTRFTNSLKVAGVSGLQLKEVQNALFDAAQKNGVELESLGVLYGRTADAAKELGATQTDLLKFSNTVALALRVQGADANTASGALLQLSQALGSGTIHAEEFNSIIEGMRPLLQAAAAGNDKWGGSVTKLTKDVKSGKVSSKEFFDAVLKGSELLEGKAANASFTLSQAFTTLGNAFTKYVGESNSATGATALLVEIIQKLANNLPMVANALAVIAGVYAASFIPGIARATVALVANGVAMAQTAAVYNVATRSIALGATALNGATAASSGLLAVLGGPLGLALTAVAAGMAYWAYTTAEANQKSLDLRRQVEDLAVKLELEGDAALNAATATGSVTKASVVAGGKLRGLKVDVETLTDKYQLLAEAARQASYDIANAAVVDAQSRYNKKVAEEKSNITPTVSVLGRDPKDRMVGINDGRATYDRQAEDAAKKSQEYRDLADAKAVRDALLDPNSREKFVEKPGAAPAVEPDKKKGGKKAPSDGTDEARELEIRRRQLLLEQTTDLDQRLRLQREILALETEDKIDKINERVANGSLKRTGADKLIASEKELATIEEANLIAENAKEVAERKNAVAEKTVSAEADALRAAADELENRAKYARTFGEKHDYELEALEKRQDADRLEFDLRKKQYQAELRLLGVTEERITAILAQMQADFDKSQAIATSNAGHDQRDEDPTVRDQVRKHAESFGSLNHQIGEIATGALDNLTNGLTDAIMGAQSLKEAFSDMAKSIIAELIQMAIRFVIFEAIGNALGFSGLGKTAIGLGKQPTGSVEIGANAMGTNNWKGGLSMVGEKGPELMYLPGGAQIAPNNLLNTALRQSAQPVAAGGGGVTLVTTVNATDAVLTSTVKGWISESQVQSVQAAERLTNRSQTKRNRNTLIR